MTQVPDSVAAAVGYEIAVALAPSHQLAHSDTIREHREQGDTGGTVAGFEDVKGRGGSAALLAKGEAALQAATEALARQIAATACRLGGAVSEQVRLRPESAACLDEVTVTFGITLSAGLQTVFTTQAESSVQVTVSLKPVPSATVGEPAHD
jgi:Trypsin-co-occurring domain 1